MKAYKFLLTIALFCLAFFTTSCTKDSLDESSLAPVKRVNRENVETGIVKFHEAIPDDPGTTSKVIPTLTNGATKLISGTEYTADDYPQPRVPDDTGGRKLKHNKGVTNDVFRVPQKPVIGGEEVLEGGAIPDNYRIVAPRPDKQ